jgi:CheY-like chemotaxis protein
MFAKDKYDLVITDYAMPAMKGDELAIAIKSIAPEQPIVLITAYAEMLKSEETPLSGVDFIVSKPFLLENLREAIEKTTPARIRPQHSLLGFRAGLSAPPDQTSFPPSPAINP